MTETDPVTDTDLPGAPPADSRDNPHSLGRVVARNLRRRARLELLRSQAVAELARLDSEPPMFARTVAAAGVTGERTDRTPEEREEWLDWYTDLLLIDGAIQRAEWCAVCGVDLGADAIVALGRVRRGSSWATSIAPMCEACGPDLVLERRCEACDRVLYDYRFRIKHRLCSERCRQQAANARRRVVHQERACEQCGELFTPKRSDARYCGATCRQRAHRGVTDRRDAS